ncbi:HSP90 [Symbiodinium natans]|uniref:HSP90 protein n=1 Tax=Symbiodinium natans TaxID=878477 RepID=A0A812LGG6_9DINO|nr:HSP90 [Symbiodinium natans]
MSCSPIPSITCDAQSGQMPQAHSKKQMKLVKDLDPSIGLSAWNCSLCLNDPNAATIYGVERWDGLGQRAASLINFMALAAHLNLNFGGLLPNPSEREHGVYIPKCMTELLGTNYKGIRRLAPEPHFDVCLFGPEAIQEAISQSGRPFGPHQSILIEECGNGREFVDYLTPEFQQRLRQATLLQRSKAVHFAGKAIHVAVHVRRGDLNNHEHWAHRNVADEIYMGLVEAVKDALAELHRSAEVHVFSSTEGGAYSSKDFDGYRSQEMRVHLNGEELNDWTHMAHADILIQAPSAFSWVPGVLNSKCVLAFDSYPKPLADWIVHSQGHLDSANKQRLRACIAKKVFPPGEV